MNIAYLIIICILIPEYCYGYSITRGEECPCSQPWMCDRIQGKRSKEVVGYAVNLKYWRKFDFSKLTTIIVYEEHFLNDDAEMKLLCAAHANGVRVLIAVGITDEQIVDKETRHNILGHYASFAGKYMLDGANIDVEFSTVKLELRNAFTQFVNETSDMFHSLLPESIVITDVFWLPNIFHNTRGLAAATDYLFIMAYDEQVTILGECTARANAPYERTKIGAKAFLELGVPANQLILGTPWYGYRYKCLKLSNHTCYIEHKAGLLSCSQTVGREIGYGIIVNLTEDAVGGLQWDSQAKSPFFTYKNSSDPSYYYQMRYDNPESLKMKYALAEELNLRGVGMWNLDSLDYVDHLNDTKAMWEALPHSEKSDDWADTF